MADTNYGSCPTCRRPYSDEDAPPEPPIGTWVKDRYGGAHVRIENGGWAAAPHGFMGSGRWLAMWVARGPLVECGPHGADL